MKRLLRLFVLGLVAWFTCCLFVAYALTRRPTAIFAEPAPEFAWGIIESFRLTTTDGQDLGAWFIDQPGNKPAVVLFHGYQSFRGQVVFMAEEFARFGCPVLLVSQRAHGDSTGDKVDFGFSGRHDVIAAIAWLEKTKPGRPILIWGTSLGAAAALFAGETLGNRIQGYILECPFRDLRTATRNRTALHLPRVLDELAYQSLNLVAPLFLPDIDLISPANAATKVPRDTPILILTGTHDFHALPEESQSIAANLGPTTRVVVIPEGRHSDLFSVAPETYRAELREFVEDIQRKQREL